MKLVFPEEGPASGVATRQSMEGRDHMRVRAQFVVDELNVESRLAKLEACFCWNVSWVRGKKELSSIFEIKIIFTFIIG